MIIQRLKAFWRAARRKARTCKWRCDGYTPAPGDGRAGKKVAGFDPGRIVDLMGIAVDARGEASNQPQCSSCSLFETIVSELKAGRFVIAGLAAPDGDFLAVSKFGPGRLIRDTSKGRLRGCTERTRTLAPTR